MAWYNQEFRSSDLNAPAFSGQAGAGIAVLNACLVDGYNQTISITGITRSGTTATATVSAADGLKLRTGQIWTMAGATGADASLYNITAVITVATTTTFTYTMAGTPTGSASGTLTADNQLRITSITRGGTGNLTATAILTQANVTLMQNDKIVVVGCTGTGAAQYNITATIASISTTAGVTTLTYLMASDPGANASGSPKYYKAGLQWLRPVAGGTNSQSYISQATVGALAESYTPRPLQVVDNAATAGGGKEMQLWGYESISADQTGTARYPTVVQSTNGACCRKSVTADATQRDWYLYGDEKSFGFEPYTFDNSVTFNGYGFYFGYVIPYRASDAYNTPLLAAGNAGFNTPNWGSAGTLPGHHFCYAFDNAPTVAHGVFWPRLYNQAGSAVFGACVTFGSTGGGIGNVSAGGAKLTYPMPSDGGLVTSRMWLTDAAGNIRARLPGVFAPLHVFPLTHGDIAVNNTDLPGVTLRAVDISAGNSLHGQILVDITGPWT